MAIHYSVSLIKWLVISFSLIERVAIPSLHLCFLAWFVAYPYLSLCYEYVRRTSRYTKNHLRPYSDFRSMDSSINIAWVILPTNSYVVFSLKWIDPIHCLLTYIMYLWLISHILWPVKQDHLIEYILVLVYYHSQDNNRLGIFRIVFFSCFKVLLSRSHIW